MKRLLALVAVVAIGAVVTTPNQADAAPNYKLQCTYEVQVQYWFFDTTGYYWSTVYSSENEQDAQFVYYLLSVAKQNGDLNKVVPNSYWRYIAVDVRLVPKCKIVWLYATPYSLVSPIRLSP